MKTQQWPQDWKRSVFIPISKKGSAKECSNDLTTSHTSKVMQTKKILQAQLQQYVNRELPDAQVGFRKGRGARDRIANIHSIIKKASRGDGIPVQLFQILKKDAVKVLRSIC